MDDRALRLRTAALRPLSAISPKNRHGRTRPLRPIPGQHPLRSGSPFTERPSSGWSVMCRKRVR